MTPAPIVAAPVVMSWANSAHPAPPCGLRAAGSEVPCFEPAVTPARQTCGGATRKIRAMGGSDGDICDVRFCSDDIPERDRLAYVREVDGRAMVKHDIAPGR